MVKKINLKKYFVIILAAGMGRRLGKAGKNKPKTLTLINNKSILDSLVKKLISVVKKVIYVVKKLCSVVKKSISVVKKLFTLRASRQGHSEACRLGGLEDGRLGGLQARRYDRVPGG